MATFEGFRISSQQRRAWLLEPAGAADLEVLIEGAVDLPALRRALGQVVARHEILRTTFHCFPGVALPVQAVGEPAAPAIEEEREALGRPWDLERGPVLRLALLRLGEEEHRLLIRLPAVCADAATLDRFLADVCLCYEAALAGEEPPASGAMQYVDYSVWQHELLDGEEGEQGRAFWRAQDLAPSEEARLPGEEAAGTGEPGRVGLDLPGEWWPQIESLCERFEASADLFLLTCWRTLLGRLSGSDPAVAVTLDGRKYEEVEEALGPFATRVPVSVAPDDGLPFSQAMAAVGDAFRAAWEWQECFSGEASFPFAFTLEAWPEPRRVGSATFSAVSRSAAAERSRVELAVLQRPEGWTAELRHDPSRIGAGSATRLAEELKTLIGAALADPEAPLGELEIVGPAERRHLAAVEEGEPLATPGLPVHRLVEAQVDRAPERLAVECAAGSLTYAELDSRANRLARRLRALGAGPEVPVAICLDRSPELLVALVAVLKAGGAYVPIDPSYPHERKALILEDVGAPVLLTRERLASHLPFRGRVLLLDDQWEEIAAESDGRLPDTAGPEHLAYVIYTSGSTGRPKGVGVSHANLMSSNAARIAFYPDRVERYLLASSFAFDSSVAGIFWTLCQGGALVLPRDEFQHDLAGFVRLVEDSRPSHLLCLPGLYRVVLEQGNVDRLGALRTLIVAGEACPRDLVSLHARTLPAARLYNEYGPTEATVWSSVFDCGREWIGDRVPIGRPIAGSRAVLLDRYGRAVAFGASGELYVGGPGVARGYVGRPDLTAERFVPAPSGRPGERLYRTGDLVRFLPDGNLDFQGRADQQVKIRGYRIELGEVEAVVARHPSVRQAAVLAREDTPGDRRLVAYVEPEPGRRLAAEELRRFTREALPEFMVPASWVVLPVLPLNPNGKVDRRRLARMEPPAERTETDPDFVAPRTPVEEVLAGLWGELLGLEAVGVHSHFFEVGGNSLVATQLVARVRDTFRVDLPQRTLFQKPTVAELAAELQALRRSDSPALPPIVHVPPGVGPAPLSFTQERLWFFDRLNPGSNAYNLIYPVDFEGPLVVEALRWALAEIARRHRVLRARFREERDGPVQEEGEAPRFAPVVDLRALPDSEREREARQLVLDLQAMPFDLGRGPLLRSLVLRLEPELHRLLVCIPQIVFDGWSLGILVREFAELYGAAATGRPSPLPELEIQYADFARWQRGWLRDERVGPHLAYWRRHLGERPPALELPLDRPRPTGRSARLDQRWLELPTEPVSALKALGRRHGATPFMVVLALLQTLLHRRTGRDRVTVGTVMANRNQPGIEGLIGFFVNTVALATDLSGGPTFLGTLERVRETAFGAADHQDLPFEKVIEAVNPERTSSGQALFQVMFVFQNAPLPQMDLPGVAMSFPRLGGSERTAAFDLSLAAAETEGGLTLALEFNRDVFEASTALRLLSHFERLLHGALEKPERPISELPMLSEAERHQLEIEPPMAPRGAPAAAEETATSRDRAAAIRAEVSDLRSKLSDKKQALLAQRLRRDTKAAPRQRIPRRAQAGPAPLSFGQERLWFLDRLEPGGTAYNLLDMVRLTGDLDVRGLEAALREVLRRHEVLRTGFREQDGEPVQIAGPVPRCPLPVVDLAGLPEPSREQVALELAMAAARRPFDLSAGAPFRSLLARLDAREHALVLVMHHIASDAWSFGVFIREVAALYRAALSGGASPLPELEIQYADFAVWQREALSGSGLASQLEHWLGRLRGAPALLDLPADRPRPALPSYRGASVSSRLPRPLADSLRGLGQSEEATLFMTLLAAFFALLGRLTGRDEPIVGTPIANRGRVELEGLVGFFVNTLVLRPDLSEDPTFREALSRVRTLTLEAFAHQDLPFEKLVEELRPERSLSHQPLFQVMFALQNAPAEPVDLPGLAVAGVTFPAATARFDLSLFAQETGLGIHALVEYSTDLFDAPTVERLLRAWESLLQAAAADPGLRLSQLPLIGSAEEQQILVEWNDSRHAAPAAGTVHELIELQMARTPDAVALEFEGGRWTYAELDRRSLRLARLLRGLGVGPESLVGICLERSPDLVGALLAVLRAGSAYVPLDPSLPAARLAFMIEDARLALLLTQESLRGVLPGGAGRMVCIDDAHWQGPEAELGPGAVPDNLAYVIYTSGSTGSPKGVQVQHRAVVNFLESMAVAPGFGARDALLAVTTLSFDIAALEFYLPLTVGGRVVLASRETASDGAKLIAALAGSGATAMQATPATWRLLLEAGWSGEAPLTMLCGGEALPRELADRLLAHGGPLWNLYGPTETTIWSAVGKVGSGDGPVPLGAAIAGTRLVVLDRWMGAQPLGIPGELAIGGVGVSRGYLGRPDLTAERFVPDPFSDNPGSRLYRTGDLARRRADGSLEFLGRIDHQVKVRGFRIELGEVEAALARHPDLLQAAVVAQPDASGESRLVAYIVAQPGREPSAADLRALLQKSLPDYMAPTAFVRLEALPLTPSGKVDRRALPAPESVEPETEAVAPRTPVEEVLARIWAEVLGRERVGIHDSFFELGGHSLLGMRLFARLREAFRVDLPLRTLFEAPSVAIMALRIGAERRGDGMEVPALELPPLRSAIEERYQPFPLTDVQQAYWVGRSGVMDLGNVSCHLYGEVEFPQLDLDLLTHAWRRLIDRHDMLRAIVLPDGRQQVLPEVPPYEIATLDLSGLDEREAAARAEAVRESMSHQVLPADRWPLFDLRASRLPGGRVRLHISFDLLISDAWSFMILLREAARFYREPEAALPPLEIGFRDYRMAELAIEESELYRRSAAYWRQRMPTLPPAPELPLAKSPGALARTRFVRRSGILEAEDWSRLKRRASRSGLTSSGVLLSAFAEVLAAWSRSPRFSLVLTLFNRLPLHPQVDAILGDFTSLTLLEVEVPGGTPFELRARRLQERLWDDLDHRHFSSVRVLRELIQSHGWTSRAAIPVVFTSTLDLTPDAEAGPGLAQQLGAESVYGITQTPQVLLDHQVSEQAGALTFDWDWVEELFPPGMVDAMFEAYCGLLRRLAANEDAWTEEWRCLAPAEQLRRHAEANATDVPVPEGLLHGPFLEQALREPERVAVISPDRSLTYGELLHLSNRLGRRLREAGALPNTLVAVAMEKGWEQAVAVFGTLTAGAAYLPVDPSLPPERFRHLLERGEVRIALTQSRLEGSLDWPEGVERIAVDLASPAGEDGPLPPLQGPADLAYVIFTSGSTGLPKGVMIDHRGALNTVIDVNRRFAVGPDDRVLALSNLNFDLSVYDLFGILAAGGAVVFPEPGRRRDPVHWLELVRAHGVTVWNSVPALARMLADYAAGADQRLPDSLRLVMLSGDWVPVGLPGDLWKLRPGLEVVSLGGATEASIWSILYPIARVAPEWTSIPYGHAMDNQRFYVLDAVLEPRADWVPGELYIGGVGLARGYWRDEEKTRVSFFEHPRTGERLYRTGDLGRWLPDGEIEFLGREDFQVKVQGHRIELGEVEAALVRHPGIRDAVVNAIGDRQEKRLVAYFLGEPGAAPPDDAELRRFLSGKLPAYMVPSAFVVMPAWPLTANGKVDRRALPAPGSETLAAGRSSREPDNPIEEALLAVVSDVLGGRPVELGANFFEIGGNSISAVWLITRVRERFQVELPLATIFAAVTLADLATGILQSQADREDREAVAAMLAELEGLSDEQVRELLAGEEAGR